MFEPDYSHLAQRAYAHIRKLVLEIGPRPAGSKAERLAQNYVQEQLVQWGYQVDLQEVKFALLPNFYLLPALPGLILIANSWLIQALPACVLLLYLIFLLLPAYIKASIARRPLQGTTRNVFAYPPTRGNCPNLILCAHLDTGRASPFQGRFVRYLKHYALYIAQRFAIALLLLALVRLVGIVLPIWFYWVIGILGSLSGSWYTFTQIWEQIAHRPEYAPGAYDNAAGVGVVLALAEHFASMHTSPQTNFLRLGFLISGAEETGLHGSREFANYLQSQRREKAFSLPAVLNLDMVGVGDKLYLIRGEGIIITLKTDDRLNKLFLQANPTAIPFWYTLRSGDYAPLVKQGIPAISLQSGGSFKAEWVYHTKDDTIEVIEPNSLKVVIQAVSRFIELFARAHENGIKSPHENQV